MSAARWEVVVVVLCSSGDFESSTCRQQKEGAASDRTHTNSPHPVTQSRSETSSGEISEQDFSF